MAGFWMSNSSKCIFAFVMLLCLVTANCWAVDNVWVGAVDSNWLTAGNWGDPPAWSNAGDDQAVFGAAAQRTISLSSDVYLHALRFDESGYLLSGYGQSSPATLVFSQGGTGSEAAGEIRTVADAEIRARIDANGGLVKSGDGVLTIVSSGFADPLTVSEGTLRWSNDSSAAAVSSLVMSGPVLNDSEFEMDIASGTSKDGAFTGSMTGTGHFSKTGTGTLLVYGSMLHTGGTTITDGMLSLASGSGFDGDVENHGRLRFSYATWETQRLTGVISGMGEVFTQGGTVVFTNDHTYTGLTTIGSGMLQLGDGGTAGSVAGEIDGTGTLAIYRSDDLFLDNTISTRHLWMQGANTVTLTGESVTATDTQIDEGTLIVPDGTTFVSDVIAHGRLVFDNDEDRVFSRSFYGGGVVTKQGSGRLSLTNDSGDFTGVVEVAQGVLAIGDSSQRAHLAADIVNNAVVEFDRLDYFLPGEYDGTISGSGVVVKSGAGELLLEGDFLHTGGTHVQTGRLTIGSGGEIHHGVANDAELAFEGVRHTFSEVISGQGRVIVDVADTVTLTGVNSFTGGVEVVAGTLRVGDGGTAGAIVGDVTVLQAGRLAFDRADGVTFAGRISGTGGLAHLGAGRLTLIGDNDYTGGTTINAGPLAIGDGGTSGTLSGYVANQGELVFNRADDSETDATITGTGLVRKLGSGRLSVVGAIDTLGEVVVEDGELSIGDGTRTGSVGGRVVNDAVVGFDLPGGSSETFHGEILGSGHVVKRGDGAVVVQGAWRHAGGTTIEAGTLQLGTSTQAGIIAGPIENNGSLVIPTDWASEVDSAISGSGTVEKTGAGHVTLTGDNTYTGTTTVAAGILRVGNGGTAGSLAGDVVVADDALLMFDRSDNITLAGAVSGAGGLTKLGANMLTLTGENTFTGGTTVEEGVLSIGDGGTGSSLVGNVENRGVVILNHSDDMALGAITGPGAITKRGPGTITLGSLASTGTMTIEAGAVATSSNSISTDVETYDTLVLQGTNAAGTIRTFYGDLSGPGTLVKRGNGLWTFAGEMRHTGGTRIEDGTLFVEDLNGDVVNNSQLVFRVDGVPGVPLASTYSGQISGSGTVEIYKDVIFTGDNLYMGDTILVGGALTLGAGGSSGSVDGRIFGLGAVVFDRADDFVFARPIRSESPTRKIDVHKVGENVLTLTDRIDADLVIHRGTVRIADGSSIHLAGDADIAFGGKLLFDLDADADFSNTTTGEGVLEKTGTGTLSVLSSLGHAGGTHVAEGVLRLYRISLPASITVGRIQNDATVELASSGSNKTYTGDIHGTGEVVKADAGLVTFIGDLNSTGGLSVTGGELRVEGSIASDVNLETRLVIDGRGDLQVTGDVTGAGKLLVAPSSFFLNGAVTLSGDNVLQQGLEIGRATVLIGDGGTRGSFDGPIQITHPSGRLVFNRGDDVQQDSPLLGYPGVVEKRGAGTLRVTSTSNTAFRYEITEGVVALAGSAEIDSRILNVAENAVLDATQLTGGHSFRAGAFAPNPTQSLRGSGTVIGDVAIGLGAELAPAGQFTVAGDLRLEPGGQFSVDLSSASADGADRVVVDGALSLTGEPGEPLRIHVNAIPGAIWPATSWTIANAGSIVSTVLDTPLTVAADGAGAGSMLSGEDIELTIANFNPGDELSLARVANTIQLAYLPAPRPGDFDGSGIVDGRDFLIWQRGQSPNPSSSADLAEWQEHFGENGMDAGVLTVPEPESAALLATTLVLLIILHPGVVGSKFGVL